MDYTEYVIQSNAKSYNIKRFNTTNHLIQCVLKQLVNLIGTPQDHYYIMGLEKLNKVRSMRYTTSSTFSGLDNVDKFT